MNKKHLLSATDEEFMNEDQLEFIRKLLLSMPQNLTSEQGTTQLTSNSVRGSDPIDQAQQEMDQLSRIRKKSKESDLLSDIEKALYKVESGDYGYYESSGEPIDIRRLLTLPRETQQKSRTGLKKNMK